jgi:hypothetical protein
MLVVIVYVWRRERTQQAYYKRKEGFLYQEPHILGCGPLVFVRDGPTHHDLLGNRLGGCHALFPKFCLNTISFSTWNHYFPHGHRWGIADCHPHLF